MKKKIIVVIILLLMMATSVLPAAEIIDNYKQNYLNETEFFIYPDDFELMAYSVSIDTWETNYKLEINSEGLTRYYCMYPEDREQLEWTLQNEFNIPSNSMDELWNEILNNDFFNLNNFYESPISVLGGGYAKLTITGNGQTNTVKTENIVVPKFDRIVTKINIITPGDSNLIYNSLMKYESNSRPFKPDKPSGDISGESGSEYEYITSCIDPEFNKVWYLFDWDDGTDSGWIGPYNSGEEVSAKHTWNLRNTYNIKVKAKDECGSESVWSDPLAVSMPKTKQKDNTFLLRMLECFYLNDFQTSIYSLKSFISNYSIDKKTINNLYQNIDEQTFWITNPTSYVANVYLQAGNYTKVEIDGCNITVKLWIEIFGNGTEEQGGTVSANDIKTSIEDFWNRKNGDSNWYIRCKEKDNDCDPEEPGCKVTFEVTVKNSEENENLSSGNWSATGDYRNTSDADGYHQIRIINKSNHRSYVNIWGPPYNSTNFPPNNGTDPYLGYDNLVGGIWSSSASAKTVAHEAGHLMGLEDQYQDVNGTSVPNTGYETNIMGSVSKCNETANRSQIEEIVNHGGVYCPCECCPEEEDKEEPENKILNPSNGEQVSSPIKVTGIADDGLGSGVAILDYILEWEGGSHDGNEFVIDPPLSYVEYELGPIYLENYVQPGDWIIINMYATDAAGNTGEDSVTITWIEEEEDIIPPVTEKTIGDPQWEEGYTIASYTPIWLEATDPEPGSGVNYIHYEVWQEGILKGSEDFPGDYVEMTFGMYGVISGIAELRWYAVDYAENVEQMHYQEHFILY